VIVALCARTDCAGGTLDAAGYCRTCARKPLPRDAVTVPEASAAAAGPGRASATATVLPGTGSAREGPWYGIGLVTLGEADEPEPVLLEGGQVPPAARWCVRCGDPVGRRGRDRGACAQCGEPFDYTAALPRPGELIDGRYRVAGVLGRGGFGVTLLAHDTQLDRRVVLKKVINDQVAATIEQERTLLTALRHPCIVRIWGYVASGRYLVLDYAGGRTLGVVGLDEPLAPVLAMSVQVLEALDYLHGRGLLHCDVKPANIVRGPEGAQVIDYGAVRTVTDPSPVSMYSQWYSPGPRDPEHQRPTAGFDLYCLGRTLEELCRDHLDFQADQPGVRSLRLLLDRATHEEPARRFTSARQFAEQLSGVIRQVTGTALARRSVVFASMTDALDGGLGEPAPISRWAQASITPARTLAMAAPPFTRPSPEQAARALPAVLPDPWEPAAGDRRPATEAQLDACHAAVRQGSPDTADRLLTEAALGAGDWRAQWYRGLIWLAKQRADLADEAFGQVRAAVPGELVPLLALGLCAELRPEPAVAARYYQTVSGIDEALAPAHFGCARMLLTEGDRAAARNALRRVPPESRFERIAHIAAIRSLAAVISDGGYLAVPDAAELAHARRLAAELNLDDLASALLAAEFAYASSSADPSGAARADLEKALRRVAGLADSERSHRYLVDLANEIRPATIWSW
jgi:serine/threonine-protein kinase PknG